MSAIIDMYDDKIYNLNQEIIRLKLIEEQYIKLKEVICPHEGLTLDSNIEWVILNVAMQDILYQKVYMDTELMR